ncbi:MAG: cupin domain-containing protein [Nitrososphaerales archaeon]
MADVYDAEEVLKKLKASGNWFHGFMSKGTMDAGILSLAPGEKDPQGPHTDDELYYVIRGHGFIRIEKEDVPIKPGSIIFVPARKMHNFHGNNDELQVLYVFAGEDRDV